MEENFIGMVYGFLAENGIDTSVMSIEEAIAKYNELQGVEAVALDDVVEEVVEAVAETDDFEAIEEIAEVVEEVQADETVEAVEEVEETQVDELQVLIDENAEVIASLNEEQLALFEKIKALVK